MSNYETRTVTKERFEVAISTEPYPAVIAEFGKAYSALQHKAREWGMQTESDDWAFITVGDDEVVLYIEREVEK